jgi:hypothetical protein
VGKAGQIGNVWCRSLLIAGGSLERKAKIQTVDSIATEVTVRVLEGDGDGLTGSREGVRWEGREAYSNLTDEVSPMGAHCDRCDTQITGPEEAVETVDRGRLCGECIQQTDAQPVPDVTEPGSWEVNEYLGESTATRRGLLGAVSRMSTAGWGVFAAGVVVVAPPTLWLRVQGAGSVRELWSQAGYTTSFITLAGMALWLALCVVMFPD